MEKTDFLGIFFLILGAFLVGSAKTNTMPSTEIISTNFPSTLVKEITTGSTLDSSTTSTFTDGTTVDSTLSTASDASPSSMGDASTPSTTQDSSATSTFQSSTALAESTTSLVLSTSVESTTSETSTLLSNLTTMLNSQPTTSSTSKQMTESTSDIATTSTETQVSPRSTKMSTQTNVQTSTDTATRTMSSTETSTESTRAKDITTTDAQTTLKLSETTAMITMSAADVKTTAPISTMETAPTSTVAEATTETSTPTTVGGAVTNTMATTETSTPTTAGATTATPLPTSTTVGGAVTTTMATTKASTPTTAGATTATPLPTSTTVGGAVTNTMATTETSTPTTVGGAVTTTMATTAASTPTTAGATTATPLQTSTTVGGAVTNTMATTETSTPTTAGATTATPLPTSTTVGGAVTTTMATTETSTPTTAGATTATPLQTSTTVGGAVTTTMATTETSTPTTAPTSTTVAGAVTTTMATTEASTPTTAGATTATPLPTSTTVGGAVTTTMATTEASTPTTAGATSATPLPTSTTVGGAVTNTMATTGTSTPTTAGATTVTPLPTSTTVGGAVTTTMSTTAASTPTTAGATTASPLPTSTTVGGAVTTTMSTTAASTPTTAGATTATPLPTSTTVGGAVTTTMATTAASTPTTAGATSATKSPTSTTVGGAVTTTMATTAASTPTTAGASSATPLPTSTTVGGAVTTTMATTAASTPTTAGATSATPLPTSTTVGGAVTTTMATTAASTPTTAGATSATPLPTSTTVGGAVTTTMATTAASTPTTAGATSATPLPTSTTVGGAVTTTMATTAASTPTTAGATSATPLPTSTTVGGAVTTTMATTAASTPTTAGATSATPLPTSTTVGGAVTTTMATTAASTPTTAGATSATPLPTSTTVGGAVTTTMATTAASTPTTAGASSATPLPTSTTVGGAVTTTMATTAASTPTTAGATSATKSLTSTTVGGAVTTTMATTAASTPTTAGATSATPLPTSTTVGGAVTTTMATTAASTPTTAGATSATPLPTSTTVGGAVTTTMATTAASTTSTAGATTATPLPTSTTVGGTVITTTATTAASTTTTAGATSAIKSPTSTTVAGPVTTTMAATAASTTTTAGATSATKSPSSNVAVSTAEPVTSLMTSGNTATWTVSKTRLTSMSTSNATETTEVSRMSNSVTSRQPHMSTTKFLPHTSIGTITTDLSTKRSQTSDQAFTTVSPVMSSPCPKDCAGDCKGNATTNLCGFCVGGSTNRSIDFGQDCAGNCNGTAAWDSCGYCVLHPVANHSDFEDCKNICHPPGMTKNRAMKTAETCSECLFPNETTKAHDACGVCYGTNSTCTDCAGTINGSLQDDMCGICGGNSSNCTLLSFFKPRIIPASTAKEISVIGAGFNRIISVHLLGANNSEINATGWKTKNSSFLQLTVNLKPGLYKLRLRFSSIVFKDSTANLTVYNKTGYKIFDVTPLEFVLGGQVFLRVNGSLPSDFLCTFYSSTNISFGVNNSINESCLVPKLVKSERLHLAITLNGIDLLDKLFQVTAFAPKPSVDICRFGATGAEIDIIFKQKIDTSKLDSCDQIFNDTTLLGSGAKCIWRSLRILTIIIGQGNNLTVPGSNLTFKSGAVKVDEELYAYALDESVSVTKPSVPLSTKAIITGPTRLPVCGTVLFSGTKSTGAGGRDLVYKWSLDIWGETQSTFEVNTSNLIEGKKYSLTLAVTNFMADSSTSTLEVVRESQAIPIVYITSNVDTSNVQLADTFHLHANVILPPCLSTELTYLWSAKSNKNVINLDSNWIGLNRYRVKKNSLPGGSVVVFTVRVSRKDNATIFSESSIEVTVKESPLQALIRGGALRTVGVDSTQELVLDASMSYDPDYEGTDDPGLKFDWTCLQDSQNGKQFPCYIGSSPFKDLSSKMSSVLRLSPNKLQANNKYSFIVNIYKGSRKASANTIIEVREGDPPEAELEPLPRGGLVIPTEPLWLRAHVRSSTPVTVEWNTLDTGNAGESYLNLTDTSNLLEPAITVSTLRNGVYISIIVIKPNILQKGMTYTLRVTIKNSASSQFGKAETKFSVLTGITSCILKVPSSYTHLESINLAAERCTTDNAANPLIYQFFAEQGNGNSFPLNLESTNPQASVMGPRYNNEQNITFSVQVCNSFAVCVRIRSSSVKIQQLKNEDLVKEKKKIINQVDEYLKTKDYDKAMLTLVNVVNIQISNRRRKRSVTPVQVTDEITAKALSIIEKSLSVTPSLNQANNIGQIISQLNDAKINNTDLESLFAYILTLVKTYKSQQTTLPPEITKTIFAKASIAPKRDGFSIDIIRQLFLQMQTFSGKFTQANSFATPQVDSSSVFSVFGSPIKIPHSNEIILDMGTQIKDKYRDWTCENNRNCLGAVIRVLSYKDAKEIFPINSTTLKVQSDIVDIGLYNPNTGDGIKVSNLTHKVNFEMKIPSVGSKEKHVCLYWDSKQMQWVQVAEAVVNRTTSTGICSSSHLSMFVVASKKDTNIDLDGGGEDDTGNSVVVGGIAGGVLAAILIGILSVVLWKHYKDRSNRVRPFNENEGVAETEA